MKLGLFLYTPFYFEPPFTLTRIRTLKCTYNFCPENCLFHRLLINSVLLPTTNKFHNNLKPFRCLPITVVLNLSYKLYRIMNGFLELNVSFLCQYQSLYLEASEFHIILSKICFHIAWYWYNDCYWHMRQVENCFSTAFNNYSSILFGMTSYCAVFHNCIMAPSCTFV